MEVQGGMGKSIQLYNKVLLQEDKFLPLHGWDSWPAVAYGRFSEPGTSPCNNLSSSWEAEGINKLWLLSKLHQKINYTYCNKGKENM